ncbi:hypothetical protein [Chitinophaga nivalis]|uniref:Uncharacterized protein n=1 Tax=Chitinophaga nivalis TaxID=2991709 RepID=A0ABT3IGY5_9BACT|nr:hypothetical protein [Chitinophaga nivalis]MCW3467076.1 hypothetical protein [Chitinophaga nivalis]MCW3483233.1 hypothetical protein [Chitinophaga nivalis]
MKTITTGNSRQTPAWAVSMTGCLVEWGGPNVNEGQAKGNDDECCLDNNIAGRWPGALPQPVYGIGGAQRKQSDKLSNFKTGRI